ncbi:unnamed protein product [Phaedon cochleariae]|uniref:Uncharacterized protein n=1 Tax=Phaedon cochleariae TaxID=80249 RepID=A0A9N9S9W3_PHACE|nr:unnamed protein product [Phaedon cochleariae]
MMSSKKDTSFTVQGRDTPVPVGSGGVVTGPHRPLPSDCQSPAGDQAVAHVGTTGSKVKEPRGLPNVGVIDIISDDTPQGAKAQPHSRLNLYSKLKRCDSLSMSDVNKKRQVNDTSFKEAGSPVKRIEDPVAFVLIEALESITSQIGCLVTKMKENPNTQRGIKETIVKLANSAEVIRRKTTKEWLETNKWEKVAIPTYEVDTQTQSKGSSRIGGRGRELDYCPRKRKKELLSPHAGSAPVNMDVNFRKLRDTSRNLESIALGNKNTKVEVKKMVSEMRAITEVMFAKYQKWLDTLAKGEEADTTLTTQVDEPRTESVLHEKRETREMGTQVNMDTTEQDTEYLIRQKVQPNCTYEEIAPMLDERWPEDLYKVTEEEIGNLTRDDSEHDVVLVLDTSKEEKKGLFKALIEKYPETEDLANTKAENIEYVINTTRTVSSRGGTVEREKYIYILPCKAFGRATDTTDEFWKQATKLKEIMDTNSRKNITMVSEGIDSDYGRKVLECVFYGSDFKIRYLQPAWNKKKDSERKNAAKEKDSIVIVKAGESSYGDILKRVKEGVDIKGLGISVKSVRKLGKGDLAVTVEGGQVNADRLRTEIRNNVRDIDVRVKTNDIIIAVTGLDITTTEEEVTAAIATATGNTVIEQNDYSSKNESTQQWTEVHYKKKGKKPTTKTQDRQEVTTRQQVRRSVNNKPIVGSDSSRNSDEDFAGADPMVWLYVGRCKPQATAEKVRSYLVKKSPEYDF